MKASGRKDWVKVLQQENMALEEILSAVTKANWMLWARRTPPARTVAAWPSTAPTYETPPHRSKHFIQSPSSPWQTPIPWYGGSVEAATSAPHARDNPVREKRVADLLQACAEQFDRQAKAKWDKMM